MARLVNISKSEHGKDVQHRIHIPNAVRSVFHRLAGAGYEAWLVGGAVRDFMMDRPIPDWDIATDAGSDEILALFRDVRSFRLKHDTVTLVYEDLSCQVTPFRGSGHGPGSLQKDLAHRDFTLNAIAYDPFQNRVLDPQGGRNDIKRKLLRAVGRPMDRFEEDPIRLLRAVRFAAALEFRLEKDTMDQIDASADLVLKAAPERIRDEILGILLAKKPSLGLRIMQRTGLLERVLPEIAEGYLKRQNHHHRFTIFRHTMETVDRVEAAPVLRWAALLHDVAKPRVRGKSRGSWRFIGHAEAGAEMARSIMERLKVDRETIRVVSQLVRHHMIGYDSGWSDGAVGRLVRRVGPDVIQYLVALRKADILAHGFPDRRGRELEELEARIRIVLEEPRVLLPSDLALNGRDIMRFTGIEPGPAVGDIISMLMDRVIDEPELNTKEHLLSLLKEINPLKHKAVIDGNNSERNKN